MLKSMVLSKLKLCGIVLAGIGMSVLSTHNAFSQAQVVPLTEQTPAGPNRPTGVPENYVITPNGYFHSSCIMEVKERETLRADGQIQHADGSIENVPACGYPHYTGRGEILTGATPRGEIGTGSTPPPAISHSWIESESVTTGGSFGELTASWVVPPTPTSNDGQTIYFFPGLEDSHNVVSILQPVLGYAGGTWSIASWNCCVSGTTYHSSFVQVNPGDVILGTIRSTCAAGVLSCATWNITTKDETLGSSTTLSNSSSDGQTFNWAFAGVLEVYAVAQCSDYPPNGEIFFSNLALYDYNFHQIITPGWSFTNWFSGTPQCNYGGAAVSSTQVTLDYNGSTGLQAPVLSDSGGGVACPSTVLEWNSVPSATSYQIWSRQIAPGLAPYFNKVWSGTATSLRVTLPNNWKFQYEATACNASVGCGPFSNIDTVSEGICP
jgi:hypothetical protein